MIPGLPDGRHSRDVCRKTFVGVEKDITNWFDVEIPLNLHLNGVQVE